MKQFHHITFHSHLIRVCDIKRSIVPEKDTHSFNDNKMNCIRKKRQKILPNIYTDAQTKHRNCLRNQDLKVIAHNEKLKQNDKLLNQKPHKKNQKNKRKRHKRGGTKIKIQKNKFEK